MFPSPTSLASVYGLQQHFQLFPEEKNGLIPIGGVHFAMSSYTHFLRNLTLARSFHCLFFWCSLLVDMLRVGKPSRYNFYQNPTKLVRAKLVLFVSNYWIFLLPCPPRRLRQGSFQIQLFLNCSKKIHSSIHNQLPEIAFWPCADFISNRYPTPRLPRPDRSAVGLPLL